jgi:hypothetical protein
MLGIQSKVWPDTNLQQIAGLLCEFANQTPSNSDNGLWWVTESLHRASEHLDRTGFSGNPVHRIQTRVAGSYQLCIFGKAYLPLNLSLGLYNLRRPH